jgi:hypothetical protein
MCRLTVVKAVPALCVSETARARWIIADERGDDREHADTKRPDAVSNPTTEVIKSTVRSLVLQEPGERSAVPISVT